MEPIAERLSFGQKPQIPIYFQPDGVIPEYFKFFDLTEFKDLNIKRIVNLIFKICMI